MKFFVMVASTLGVVQILAILPVALAFVNFRAINHGDVSVLSNLKSKLPALQAAKEKIGGIYEFAGSTSGSDPPPEIAELLGI